MATINYIAPAYRSEPEAQAFADLLAKNIGWSVEDFGGDYAWNAPIPPRADWEREITQLAGHLGSLECPTSEFAITGLAPGAFDGMRDIEG